MAVVTGPPVEERIGRRRAIGSLREAAAGCTACPLYANATQTVFGRGPAGASLLLVGEQPGDREDVEASPSSGPPAGFWTRRSRRPRSSAATCTSPTPSSTWRQGRGKRRLHQRPNTAEIKACRPWLEAEIAAVQPEVVVCLGAVAAQALLGPAFKVTRDRGTFVEPGFAPLATGTIHPSAILRMDDEEERKLARHELARDLAGAAGRAAAA